MSAVEVVSVYAKIHAAPSKEAPFLVLTERGKRFRVVAARGSWYRVALKDTTGWIFGGDVKPFDPAAAAAEAARVEAEKAAEAARQAEARAFADSLPAQAPPSEPAVREPPSPPRSDVVAEAPLPPPPPKRAVAAEPPPSSEPPARTAAPAPRRAYATVAAPEKAPPQPRQQSTTAAPKQSANVPVPVRPDQPVRKAVTRREAEAPPNEAKHYAQTLTGPLKILAEVSPDSPILGLVNKGSNLPIVVVGDSWVKVSYRDTVGWLEKRHISIVEKPTAAVVVREFLVAVAVLLSVGFLLLVVRLIVFRRDKVRTGWVKTVSVQKNLLVIARDEKYVQRYLSDTTTTLTKCFSEVGFRVTIARNGNDVMKLLVHYLPDVMAIDWDIDPNIHSWTERVMGSKASMANVFVIFYNVLDPATVLRNSRLQNAQFLGPAFTDREIFALVTPRVITGERPAAIRKSVETSALEGDVGQGSLAEVFQFVEIGGKTGCLLIETSKPYGIIYFRQGLIVYAATGRETADKAVYEMLNLSEGRFRFVLDHQPKTTNCSLPTLAVLMEWSRLVDEAARR